MSQRRIKVVEAEGLALDWLVSRAQGRNPMLVAGKLFDRGDSGRLRHARYSSDWHQGGPVIIGRRIATEPDGPGWKARLGNGNGPIEAEGYTWLQAGLRCYVASELGETYVLPRELMP